MTAPWVPMPNPGGQLRRFAREITTQWIADASIAGLNNVYPGVPMESLYDDDQPGSQYRCNASVHSSNSRKNFKVLTGPNDLGGYFAHYDMQVALKHVATSVDRSDWWQAENDHDRILDAIEDRFRGEGRDLGRPDVVLQAAAWPDEGSITDETGEPVYDDGVRTQWSSIFFTITIYMQRQP